jgi:hypothetical protein
VQKKKGHMRCDKKPMGRKITFFSTQPNPKGNSAADAVFSLDIWKVEFHGCGHDVWMSHCKQPLPSFLQEIDQSIIRHFLPGYHTKTFLCAAGGGQSAHLSPYRESFTRTIFI